MTEKEVYQKGVALLEEWEDVNYCEHTFKFKDDWLDDKEVVDLLNALHEENIRLKRDFDSCSHNWSIMYDEAKEKVEELTKEKWELKQENKQLEQENEKLENRLWNCQNVR